MLPLFRLLFMPALSKASPCSSDVSADLDVAAEHCKSQGPDDAENEACDKVCLRADLPEKGAAQGGNGNKNVPDQIIEPEHAGFAVVR